MVMNPRGKKGVFFTAMVIVIISLLGVSYLFYSNLQNREAVHNRISTMNNYLVSIEKNLPRQLYISGFRAVFSVESRITETGNFVSDINSSLNELFFNGTIYSEPREIMAGATMSDILDSMNSNAEKVNAVINISDAQFSVSQIDPWSLRFVLTMNLILSDRENLVRWNKTEIVESFVPITDFEDPFYALNTNNLVTNNITRTPYTTFGQDNLSAHALNSYYKSSAKAPSFLDRLEGKTSPNPNGIESFVNLNELSSQGIAIEEKSAIDYIYFSSNDPPNTHISGMPSWFRIDNDHLADYNLA
ncbi:MAG: hypothetical protein MUF61_01225 [archaeon]|nr:hypothetical protein [archaeon]